MQESRHQVTFQVQAQEGGPIREFLKARGISERAMKKLRHRGEIRCNGQAVTWRRVVQVGDEVVLLYPTPIVSEYLPPEAVNLSVMYEDQDVVVVNKQPGLCVHPTLAHPTGTLANGLLFLWQQRGEEASFHAVHRLDRATSGLVLVAKNTFSAQQLFSQRQQGVSGHTYLALVHGRVEPPERIVDLPLERCEGRTTKRQVTDKGQRAVTHYQVSQYLGPYTLLWLSLETGRTHQIRVHMAHLGFPLVGDALYGGSTQLIQRHCLHAASLKFLHPRTGQSLSFEAPLPEDMEALILQA